MAAQSPQDRMQMRALHPISESRGAGIPPPQNRLPAPLQTVKAPGGEGKSSALPAAQEIPLPQLSRQTVQFKELFHSGKRKAHVKRKSEGHRRRQLVHRGKGGNPGSTYIQPCQCLLLTPGTQHAPRSLPLPRSLAASPSTRTHRLPQREAQSKPPHTDHLPHIRIPPHTVTEWGPAAPSRPLSGSRARSPFPCP